jgi:hypothetical protein
MQRRDRHPEHLGNLLLAKQTIILEKCALHFSVVSAREQLLAGVILDRIVTQFMAAYDKRALATTSEH